MGRRIKELLAAGKLVEALRAGPALPPQDRRDHRPGTAAIDAVWLDQEHAGLTIAQIEHALPGGPCRRPGLVRPPDPDRLRHGDAAAGGRRRRHHGRPGPQRRPGRGGRPLGQVPPARACAASTAPASTAATARCPPGEYLRQANAETFVAIQIEHIDAVADVEQIAALPDVDVLFIGPADLSQSMGIPGEWDHAAGVAGDRARGARRAKPTRHPLGDPAAQPRLRPALRASWAAGCCRSASTSRCSSARGPGRRF